MPLEQTLPEVSETTKELWQFMFYVANKMPCCGHPIGYFTGPRGGLSINIKCTWCGRTWNICPEARFIERI